MKRCFFSFTKEKRRGETLKFITEDSCGWTEIVRMNSNMLLRYSSVLTPATVSIFIIKYSIK